VAERVNVEVPEVEVVRLDGGAHLVNRDSSEEFNHVLLRFLRAGHRRDPVTRR
jgi:hypothetical protein